MNKNIYRYEPDLDQLNVQPLEQLLSETPVGLFTLSLEEIKNLFSGWSIQIPKP